MGVIDMGKVKVRVLVGDLGFTNEEGKIVRVHKGDIVEFLEDSETLKVILVEKIGEVVTD